MKTLEVSAAVTFNSQAVYVMAWLIGMGIVEMGFVKGGE